MLIWFQSKRKGIYYFLINNKSNFKKSTHLLINNFKSIKCNNIIINLLARSNFIKINLNLSTGFYLSIED